MLVNNCLYLLFFLQRLLDWLFIIQLFYLLFIKKRNPFIKFCLQLRGKCWMFMQKHPV